VTNILSATACINILPFCFVEVELTLTNYCVRQGMEVHTNGQGAIFYY